MPPIRWGLGTAKLPLAALLAVLAVSTVLGQAPRVPTPLAQHIERAFSDIASAVIEHERLSLISGQGAHTPWESEDVLRTPDPILMQMDVELGDRTKLAFRALDSNRDQQLTKEDIVGAHAMQKLNEHFPGVTPAEFAMFIELNDQDGDRAFSRAEFMDAIAKGLEAYDTVKQSPVEKLHSAMSFVELQDGIAAQQPVSDPKLAAEIKQLGTELITDQQKDFYRKWAVTDTSQDECIMCQYILQRVQYNIHSSGLEATLAEDPVPVPAGVPLAAAIPAAPVPHPVVLHPELVMPNVYHTSTLPPAVTAYGTPLAPFAAPLPAAIRPMPTTQYVFNHNVPVTQAIPPVPIIFAETGSSSNVDGALQPNNVPAVGGEPMYTAENHPIADTPTHIPPPPASASAPDTAHGLHETARFASASAPPPPVSSSVSSNSTSGSSSASGSSSGSSSAKPAGKLFSPDPLTFADIVKRTQVAPMVKASLKEVCEHGMPTAFYGYCKSLYKMRSELEVGFAKLAKPADICFRVGMCGANSYVVRQIHTPFKF